MMDILAATSSAPRLQDRGESGRSTGDTGFADLLGTLGGKASEAPQPASRRRRDDDLQEAAAVTEGPAEKAVPAERGTASREAEGAAEPAAGTDDDQAGPTGRSASGETGSQDRNTSGAAAPATAGQATAGQTAAQAPGQVPGLAMGQAMGQAAPAGQLPAGAEAALTAGATTAGATTSGATAAAAAATPSAASPQGAAVQAAAGTFRLAPDGPSRGEVRLAPAGQGPRAALSGNTALAASLASSTETSEPAIGDGAIGAGSAGGAQKGTAGIVDGTTARTFAGLAAESAAQSAGDAAGGGRTQVLQGAGDGDILLAADAARPQATLPGQAAAGATPANPSPPSQAPMADQVAVQMHRALASGKDRLSIQLHPAELGRIDIKLELAQDGSVRAVLQAERKDTMDLLQRDVRGLERALQNAGLQTDGNSISFDLRGGQQQRSGQGFASPFPSGERGADAGLAESGDGPAKPGRGEARHDGAVNIRV